MSRGELLSVLTIYHWDNSLFDQMVFPDGFTDEQKQIVIGNILSECAELECLFPDWATMHTMIGLWSKYNVPAWNRIYQASLEKYNPIENYNRTEIETIKDRQTDNGKRTGKNTSSGNDTTSSHQANTGQDVNTNKQTAYDSGTEHVHDSSTLAFGHNVTDEVFMGYGRTDTQTGTDENTHTGDITRQNNTSGNIGVTTSQQMLTQEIEIAIAINIFPIICDSFKERFCILVY